MSTIIKIIKKFWYIFFVLIIILAFISYKYFFDQNSKTFKNIISNVYNINSSPLKNIKGNIINSNDSINTLTDMQSKLIMEKNKLDTLSVPKKYSSSKPTLQLALSENIKICEQITDILKNQNASDIGTSLTNLETTYSSCVKHYKKCLDYNLDCGFLNNFSTFYNHTVCYINEIIKIKRDNDIKNKQNYEFVSSMQDISEKFNKITEDLMPAIERAKSEKRTLNIIINDIYEKQTVLSDIEKSFLIMSYPNDCTTCYNLFNSTLDKYNDYISCLLDTLKKDIKNNSENYKDVNKKYSDMMNEYKKFNESLNKLYR